MNSPLQKTCLFSAFLALAMSLTAAETPSTCVTMIEDVVDPDDGLISFREAVAYAGSGECGNEITFSLEDPCIELDETVTIDKDLSIEFINRGLSEYGGLMEIYCHGGSVLSIPRGVTVSITSGEFRSRTDVDGGAICNAGDLRLNSVFLDFCAGCFGGAIYNEGSLTATDCTFQNDDAEQGGAIYNIGFATLRKTTFGSCTAVGGSGGAIYNVGDLILEDVYFGGNEQCPVWGWDEATETEFVVANGAGAAIYNSGYATVDRATFQENMGFGSGLVLANASNAVLQVNNAAFNYNLFLYWGDDMLENEEQRAVVWNESGGSLTLLQSSFAQESLNPVEYEEPDEEMEEPCFPYVRVDSDAFSAHILNCAFAQPEADALIGAENAVLRGCVFAESSDETMFTALLQGGADFVHLALAPETNINERTDVVDLRKFVGVLEWCEDGVWQPTGTQIPYWTDEALSHDLLGASRQDDMVFPKFPGAMASEARLEPLSNYVTTGEDIDDPTDGLISLREAFRYSVQLAHIATGEGLASVFVEAPDSMVCTLSNGPIVIDSQGRPIELCPLQIVVEGGGRCLDIVSKCSFYCPELKVMNASCTDGGGAALRMRSGGSASIHDCVFSNCVAAANGGAIELQGRHFARVSDCAFYGCSAGEDGGAIASEGKIVPYSLLCEDCSAGGRGGAIFATCISDDEYAPIGTFRRNRATQGGAIWAEGSEISDGAFYDNVAALQGGALAGAVSLVQRSCFVRNSAPRGAAFFSTSAERVVVCNATFLDNVATDPLGASVESFSAHLRLGNCGSWNNLAEGALRLVRSDRGVGAFNSLLPDVLPEHGVTCDAVTRIGFADHAAACYRCEPDGLPSLAKFGGQAALCPLSDLQSLKVAIVTRGDGSRDLAGYVDAAEDWLDCEGNSVSGLSYDTVQKDQRGEIRRYSYGIGPLASAAWETSSGTVTTLSGQDDSQDGRITLNEAISTLHSDAQWIDEGEIAVLFDVSDTTNRVLRMTSEMRLTTASSVNFGEKKVLVVDGDCGDGSHIVIDLCGGAWFKDYSHNNNFIFRNLTFRNGGGDQPTFVFSDVLEKGVTGSVRFENCSFEDISGVGVACVDSQKPVAFVNCAFLRCSGTGVVRASGVQVENCSVVDTRMSAGGGAVLSFGRAESGDAVNLVVNLSICGTTWNDGEPGSLVWCGGTTDLGNVTAGRNGEARFCGTAADDVSVRLLNAIVDCAVGDAVVEGDFCDACDGVVSRRIGELVHGAPVPSQDANPGSRIAYYSRSGVMRLAVKTDSGWFGADGAAVGAGDVNVIDRDLFGQSRVVSETYTCGALCDMTEGLVVTTDRDVVDADDGVVSLREAIEAARGGLCQLSGAKRITFAIPGVRNPVISLGAAFELTDSDAFGVASPLEICGSNRSGRVTFDGEGRYRIFRVGAETGLVLTDCVLMHGRGDFGGAIRADGALELKRVTVSDSVATSLGGGLYGAAVVATDSVFERCSSANNGGAVCLAKQGSFIARNVAFRSNSACGFGSGGAVYALGDGFVDIDGASFNDNEAGSDGPVVYAGVETSVRLDNIILSGNVAMDPTWETAAVFGSVAVIDLCCVTSLENVYSDMTDLRLLDGLYSSLSVADSLVCEGVGQSPDVMFSDCLTAAGADAFQCVDGVPLAYGRSFNGVRHVFRLPSELSVIDGTSVCEADLFGNSRTNRTLGAVTFGGKIPDEEVTVLALAGAMYVDLDASRLSLAEGTVVTEWPNAGSEGSFVRADETAGPTYQLRDGVPVVRFDGVRSVLKSANVIPDGLAGDASHSVELWVYAPTLLPGEQTMLALTPREGLWDNDRKGLEMRYSVNARNAVEHWGSGNNLSWTGYDRCETPRGGGSPSVGEWHYVVNTYDGSKDALYLDGRLVSAKYALSLDLANDGCFTVGGVWNRSQQSYGFGFSGDLARVRVQGGCLTPEQVQANFIAENDTFKRSTDTLSPVWQDGCWEDGTFADGASVNISGDDVAEVADKRFAAWGWQIDNGTLRLRRSHVAIPDSAGPQIVTGYGAQHAAGLILAEATSFSSAVVDGTVFGLQGGIGSCRVEDGSTLVVTNGPLIVGCEGETTYGELAVENGGAVTVADLGIGLNGAKGFVRVAGDLSVAGSLQAGSDSEVQVAAGGRLTLKELILESEESAFPLTVDDGTLSLSADLTGNVALTLSGDAAIEVPAGCRVTVDVSSIEATGFDVTLTKRGGGTLVLVPAVSGSLGYYIEEGALDLVSSLQEGQSLTVGPNGLFAPRQKSDCFVTWQSGVPERDYYRVVSDRLDGIDLCDLFPFYRTDGLKGPTFGEVLVDGTVTHYDVTADSPFALIAESNTLLQVGYETALENLPLSLSGGGGVELSNDKTITHADGSDGLTFADGTLLRLPMLSLAGESDAVDAVFANGRLETEGLAVAYGADARLTLSNMTVEAREAVVGMCEDESSDGISGRLTLATGAVVRTWACGSIGSNVRGEIVFAGGRIVPIGENCLFNLWGEGSSLTVRAERGNDIELCYADGAWGELAEGENVRFTGEGGFRKTGDGYLGIRNGEGSVVMDYSGDTVIAEGVIAFEGDISLPTGPDKGIVRAEFGAGLYFGGGTVRMNNLYDNGTSMVDSPTTLGFGLGDVSTTLGTVLPSNVALLKEGSGALDVIGSFDGTCRVEGGAVRFADPQFRRYRMVFVNGDEDADTACASGLQFRLGSDWMSAETVRQGVVSNHPAYVELIFGTAQKISSYQWARPDASVPAPECWVLQGSDDGVLWTTLDRQEWYETDPEDLSWQSFVLSRTAALQLGDGVVQADSCSLYATRQSGGEVALTNAATLYVDAAKLAGRVTGDGSLVKTGDGTAQVSSSAKLLHTGETRVESGCLSFIADRNHVTGEDKWLRFTFKESFSGDIIQLSELAVYDSDGNNLCANLTACEYDVADADLPSGSCRFDDDYDTGYGEGLEQLFDGNVDTKCCLVDVWLCDPEDESTWRGVTIRLADDAPCPVGYNFTTANDATPGRNPISWTVQCSSDGVTWHDIDEKVKVTSHPTETYTAYNGGEPYALKTAAEVSPGEAGYVKVVSLLSVSEGASVRVEVTNGLAFAALKVDWEDCGSISFLPTAAEGRIEIVNAPDDVPREFVVPLTVDAWSGSLAKWQITVNGVDRQDQSLEYRDGSLWVVDTPVVTDPIPALPEKATGTDIAEALSGSTDPGLTTNLKTVEQYNSYRAWAQVVELPEGGLAGAQTVKGSDTAWLSFALNSAILLARPPKQGEMSVASMEQSGTEDAFDLMIDIVGVTVGDGATENNLSSVFKIEGATSLDDEFSGESVKVSFGKPKAGKVTVSASPVDTSTSQFFIRVKLN